MDDQSFIACFPPHRLSFILSDYPNGVGLEGFEECERTFCRSNKLATVTRLATPYHRQQHIDEHFRFHDLDKHIASGKLSPSDLLL